MKEEDLWHEQKTLLESVGGKFYWDSYLKDTLYMYVCYVDRADHHMRKLVSYLQTTKWNFSELP